MPVLRWLLVPTLCLLACCAPATRPAPAVPTHPPPAPAVTPVDLGALVEGQRVAGFVARARYVDDEGHARGARLVHERTRFVLDTLAIESAPQAFVYATTYPSSDSGAAHTQEHLLLGKGNKGRWLGNYDHVALAAWSAFTAQYRTAYHFHTSAGVDAFWGILRTQLEALLHPDYSDEEIRREVRTFAVSPRHDGTLELEEAGTVYNEMVGTYDGASMRAWDAIGRLLYGEDHPLALSSGGTPEGLRQLTVEDIRRFHAAHYQLANMGMVAAFPSAVPLPTVLAKIGATLDALAPSPDTTRYPTEADLPAARGAEPGALRVVEYPYATADHPGPAILGWPATRHLDLGERTLLSAFLEAFAGGAGSTMYQALVDTKTRTLDVGATSVWASASDDLGNPVLLGVENVGAAHADEASLRALRDLVASRLRAVAALPDGSPELAAFGERVRARVLETRRWLDKALDTPPGFGTRGTGDFWIAHLASLCREPGFTRSLTQQGAFDRAMTLAGSTSNPWRERIAAWGLLESPYGVVAHASPAVRQRLDQERQTRVASELARLEASYGVTDPQEALRRRQAEIAQGTEELAKAEASVPMPPFVSDPPMTMDDTLAYRESTAHGVPVVASTFETMKSATVGLSLGLDGVAEADLPYLALLPQLLREVGVVRDGTPVPYDAMSDRLRREVLGLGVSFDTSFATGRARLSITGSGNDAQETRRALGWMRDVLTSPDWRAENLPRIRDVVERTATELRNVTSSPEEHWVTATAESYRWQDSAVLMHTASFLARAYDALRLSWMLEGADADASKALASLAPAGKHLDRAGLTALAQAIARAESHGHDAHVPPAIVRFVTLVTALPAASSTRVARAGRELAQLLPGLPDASLASDWASLCTEMARDSARDPRQTLEAFRRVLGAIAHAGQARVWMVGSSRTQAALQGELDALLAALDPAPVPSMSRSKLPRITDRARARGAAIFDPRLAALVNPSTASGSVVDSAPTAGFGETRDDALVDFLAANVFSGTGTHSFYKRIWGAALAYSGYMAVSPVSARMYVYSDRCADLRQLLRFVDGEVRRAPADPRFVEYAVANTFHARTADTYESRAAAMATDLLEGITPDRVRAFRARLLELQHRPRLADALHARLMPVYGAVIPSLVPAAPVPEGAQWFSVGPEAQLAAWEQELRAVRGEKLSVLRLYPRDYWDVPGPPLP